MVTRPDAWGARGRRRGRAFDALACKLLPELTIGIMTHKVQRAAYGPVFRTPLPHTMADSPTLDQALQR